jgi:Carbohydrate esterase, sialic acid-specific acetylesterase
MNEVSTLSSIETIRSAADTRPFYFMVPFWGERYRRYFTDNLLPSLLAPNNLPLLRAADGHRFLLATTKDDWDAIIDLPIMERLRPYATPTLIEIPRPGRTAPGSTSAILHQNVAQRLMVIAAFEAKAYGSLFSPDFIVSDGMIASLIARVRAGQRVVLCPSLRQIEETALTELERTGYLGPNPSAAGAAINVPQRVLADILVRHLHPEMAIFEEGAVGQPPLAPFRYWRIPGQNGLFIHTFHGVPVLMDYQAVARHDIECLDTYSFEDVYVARNFSGDDLHVVSDTDEFCILSLTPGAIGQMTADHAARAVAPPREGVMQRLLAALSISYCTAQMPLKKQLFKHSVRWHGGDLDAAALAQERRIDAFVDGAVRSSRYTTLPALLLLNYRETPLFRRFVPYARVLVKALLGDRQTWANIRQRLSFEIKRPFKRTLFWFASGRDLDRFDPLHLSFRKTAARRNVSVTLFAASPATAVILGVGQSNIANEGDAGARYAPKGDVYNFNFFDGRCYVAKDPLLGASIDRSNMLTRLGEFLVERRNYERVLLAPIAHGGTFARDWAPSGRMFPRLEWTLERLRESRVGITHILWQQGEAEAAESKPDAQAWMRHFMAMVAAIRASGADAPIYVAQCTICRNDPNETIRAAQRSVVDPAAGIFAGPDIDQIGANERYDGCHMSAAGLRHAAELWYDTLCRTH